MAVEVLMSNRSKRSPSDLLRSACRIKVSKILPQIQKSADTVPTHPTIQVVVLSRDADTPGRSLASEWVDKHGVLGRCNKSSEIDSLVR